MAWFKETKRTWLENLCIKTLKCGPIPKHVALIMDGNRRYASKLHIQHIQGHMHGFDKLSQTLQWCLDLGIREVTVYAFSIENFKRSNEEVQALMQMAREKFRDLLKEKEALEKNGVCIRVFGKLSLLPLDVQQLLAKAVLMTKSNDRVHLNVCLAYTSREEMTTAVQELAEGVDQGLIKPEDVTEELFDKCLCTSDSSPPDLLVRTSGERRLSDFLLWQSSFSVLAFLSVLWPEFSIWHLFMAILFYQYHFQARETAFHKYKKMFCDKKIDDPGCSTRQQMFIDNLKKKRLNELENLKLGLPVDETS